MNYFRIIFFSIIALTVGGHLALADEKDEVLDSVQKQYDKTRTFKARFIQKSYLKIMDQTQEAQGEVIIKKPGKMKWDYRAPDPQILISNEKGIWLYLPEEKQVTKMAMENIYSANTPALFLVGEGKLRDSFKVDQVLKKDKTLTLILIPSDKGMNIDRLFLFVEHKSYQITGSTVYDNLGNETEILFSDIQVNLDLSDDLFEFKIPDGVDLIDFSEKP